MVSKKFLFTIFICYAILGLCAPVVTCIWPEVAKDIAVDTSLLGILVTLNCATSGVSSYFAYKVRSKLGTNYTNILGLVFFGIGMIIFANLKNYAMAVFAMLILGLGNGIVDVNSNSYVVKAYDAKWVSLMHSCWGLASSIGPLIMSAAIIYTSSYRNGFNFILAIIIATIIVLLLLKKSWLKKRETLDKEILELHSVSEEEKDDGDMKIVFKTKGALEMLLCFTFSSGAGCASMAWLATILVTQKNISVVEGATAVTAFSIALMVGRISVGFVAEKIGIKNIIKLFSLMCILSLLLLFLPYKNIILIYLNAAFAGFVSGPISPLLNVDIKNEFDKNLLSKFISLGGVFGLLGVASISVLMTVASRVISINYIQIIPAIGFLLLFLLYSRVVNINRQNNNNTL